MSGAQTPVEPWVDGQDKFREECGVCAIVGHPEAAKLAYLSLYALQHRGQESAGICSSDGKKIYRHKGTGLVHDVFGAEAINKLKGTMAIGHTRYSTAGDIRSGDAQPFHVDECNMGPLAVAHNGNLTNGHALRRKLRDSGSLFLATHDTEVILHLIARTREPELWLALRESLLQLEGAFSLAMLAKDQVIVARDPRGFRPLAHGIIPYEGGVANVFASETCAFDLIGAEYLGEVEPGEMIICTPEGIARETFLLSEKRSQCVFEQVYFARPDSTVFGRSVHVSREALGRQLARESAVPADCVVAVPDSGNAAAVGFAKESGIRYDAGLIRNHYVGRTFIEPKQSIRDFGVKLKLNPVRSIVEGKRLIVVDDSLVRGTTSQKIVRLLRSAGAEEVHLRIACPPTVASCYFGVDTPDINDLIASRLSVEEICSYTDADSLAYLSMEGLRRAVDDFGDASNYCYSCYTGNYPSGMVAVEDLVADYRRKNEAVELSSRHGGLAG